MTEPEVFNLFWRTLRATPLLLHWSTIWCRVVRGHFDHPRVDVDFIYGHENLPLALTDDHRKAMLARWPDVFRMLSNSEALYLSIVFERGTFKKFSVRVFAPPCLNQTPLEVLEDNGNRA